MHILITNDDGVDAPGLLALKQALEPLGRLTVIAPERNSSSSGHRKTMHKPLRLDSRRLSDGSTAFACSGSPADCVALALLGFVKERIDVVVSGINPSPNLGHDVTYSGTVTAAMEAVIGGVPGIAVSVEGRQGTADFGPAARVAARVVQVVAAHDFPATTLLNVNVPGLPETDLKGLRITRQGRRHYRDRLIERQDPRGRPYYWIGGEIPAGAGEGDTDIGALAEGFVSITPLRLDLTDNEALLAMQTWEF